MPGRFMWYELITTDAKAAGTFYRSVVGWKTSEVGGPGSPYTTFHVGEANGMAGMVTLSETVRAGGASPVWMGYVGVDDVDAYAERLAKAGGAVHQPPRRHPRHRALLRGRRSGRRGICAVQGVQPRRAADRRAERARLCRLA